MLSRLFGLSLRGLRHAGRQDRKTILFICATKLQEDDFWERSATGRSLALLEQQQQSPSLRMRWDIAYDNTLGLPAIYNAGLDRAGDADIVVFLHDDIWFRAGFLEAVEEGLQEFHVIGAVGNMRCLPAQPSWLYMRVNSREGWVDEDPAFLSGVAQHGSPEVFDRQDHGHHRSACELLDGLLLAADAHALRKVNARFDERFDFHFYDLDFCRNARSLGLHLGTWPLDLIHESGGHFGSERWIASYVKYLDKWVPGWTS